MYNELLQQFIPFTGQNIPLEDVAALLVNAYMIKIQYQPTCSPKEQIESWKQYDGEYNFTYKRNSFTYDLTIINSSSTKLQLILKGSDRTIKGELDIQKYISGIQLNSLKEDSLKDFDSFMSRTIKNDIEPRLVFQQPQMYFDTGLNPNISTQHHISPPNDLLFNVNHNLISMPNYNPEPYSGPNFVPPRLDGNLMGPGSFNPQPKMPNLMPRYDPISPFGNGFDFSPMQDGNMNMNNNPQFFNSDLNPFGDPFNVKKANQGNANPFPKFI